MSSFVNVIMFALLIWVVGFFKEVPAYNGMGFLLFALAGLLNTIIGRGTLLSAIRSIGPSRAVAYKSTAPAVAMITGFFLLGEVITVKAVIGVSLSILGLILITRETSKLGGELDLRKRNIMDNKTSVDQEQAKIEVGVLLGMASAIAFGLGFVVRKSALLYWPSAEMGSLIGAVAAVAFFAGADLFRGQFVEVARSNLLTPSIGFIWGGVLSGIGMITTLLSLMYANVTVAAVIGSLDPLCSLVASPFLLGKQERLTWMTGAGILTTLGGVVLIIMA